MNQQNDYQFVMIPQQLTSCLDANCGKMLNILLGLSSLLQKEDGWFYRSNKDLQLDTRLSENVVRATLDTLYRAGIINIDCIGKGRGHRTNRILINFESFKVYEQYSFNDIRNNPDLWIETVKYKDHFVPSYMRKCEKVSTSIESSEDKCEEICECKCEKVSTNTDTTDTSNTLNTKENNLINKEETMLVNLIEEKENLYDDSERNIITTIEEEKKPCTKEYLKTIYLNSFGELMSNYPGINYSLLLVKQRDSFYDCYRDIVNELVMKIHQQSQRNVTTGEVLEMLNKYLDYIKYPCQ